MIRNVAAKVVGTRALASSLAFYSSSTSATQQLVAKFVPNLPRSGKIIVPVSMGRLNPTSIPERCREAAIEQYHAELHALLGITSAYMHSAPGREVVVLSTAGLQKYNWDKATVERVEDEFSSRHRDLLLRHTDFLGWESFLSQASTNQFNNYEMVLKDSGIGTSWYETMVSTYKKTKMSTTLADSLAYQRSEYAAMLSMKQMGFSHILYLGRISEAWQHMYNLYPDLVPPYIHAKVEKESSFADTLSNENPYTQFMKKAVRDFFSDTRVPKSAKVDLAKMAALFCNEAEPVSGARFIDYPSVE